MKNLTCLKCQLCKGSLGRRHHCSLGLEFEEFTVSTHITSWITFLWHVHRANTLVAHLGEHDTTQTEGTEQNLNAALVIHHPNYNDKTQDNDIMLVKLATPAQFNQYVSPIQLPTTCPASGTWCLVSGWGNLRTNGGESCSHGDAKEPHLPLLLFILVGKGCSWKSSYARIPEGPILCT